MGASGGMLTLRCRDTYYGQQTPITPSQRTWRVSFEANADSARGCVQVGFRTKRSIYPYYTWYGTYNLGSPREGLPRGGVEAGHRHPHPAQRHPVRPALDPDR